MFLLPCGSPIHAQDVTEFWPEVDTYVKINPVTRFFFITAISSDQDTRELQGEFGPNLDFFLKPMLRPRLRDADPSKSKYFTIRVGYRYMPTLRGNGSTENRLVQEFTGRFYLPGEVLLSNRNRFDLRFMETQPFSWRYRNRLTLERSFEIRRYAFTPYVRGELFYDSRYDKIAKNAFTIGSVFPITKRMELEMYYEDQRNSSSTPNYHTRGAGVALGLYF